MSLCPCGSTRQLDDCCQPIIENPKLAVFPEQLMRSRYTAHCIKNTDYVVATYHVSCQAESYRDAIAESVEGHWFHLEILDAPEPNNDEGFVHFVASYREGNACHFLEERSRFVKENGQWYYIDGVYPENPKPPKAIGRNDTCPCGSGKKYKKCCAI